MSDVWERLRHMTLDQLVTHVKLYGSGAEVRGRTTPEGYPFCLVVAVGKPENERAGELVREASEEIAKLARWSQRADNPDLAPDGDGT